MQSNKSPQPGKGPGLAGTVALIGGMVVFLWLASHPQAWPNAVIGSLLHAAGKPLPPIIYPALGGLAFGLLALIPLSIWESGKKEQKQLLEARKAAKAAMQIDAERAKLEAQKRGFADSDFFVADWSGEAARKRNQATPGFVLALVAAVILIACAFQYYLTNF